MKIKIKTKEKINITNLFFNKGEDGFTLPEVVIVTGIFLMLFGFIIFNVINLQHRTSVDEAAITFASDIKSQQLKAMEGATEGRTSADIYGIHFDSTSYTLFHGSTYNSADSANLVINLDKNISFNNDLFPNSNLVFLQGSGEVSGFVSGQNTITIQDANASTQKTITINRFGTITSVN